MRQTLAHQTRMLPAQCMKNFWMTSGAKAHITLQRVSIGFQTLIDFVSDGVSKRTHLYKHLHKASFRICLKRHAHCTALNGTGCICQMIQTSFFISFMLASYWLSVGWHSLRASANVPESLILGQSHCLFQNHAVERKDGATALVTCMIQNLQTSYSRVKCDFKSDNSAVDIGLTDWLYVYCI